MPATAEKEKAKLHYIGFYGCAEADRVVCVGAPPDLEVKELMSFRKYAWKQRCTACGRVHIFQPLWRRVTEHQRWDKSEQYVTRADAIMPPRVRYESSDE